MQADEVSLLNRASIEAASAENREIVDFFRRFRRSFNACATWQSCKTMQDCYASVCK